MRKFFVAFIVSVSIFLATSVVWADSYGLDKAANVGSVPTKVAGSHTVAGVIGGVVANALALVGIVFFAILLYAGLRWMTAMGDSGVVDKSKEMIISAIIGIVVVVSAYAISNFVFTELVK